MTDQNPYSSRFIWTVPTGVGLKPRAAADAVTGVVASWRAGDKTARTGLSETDGEIGALGAEIDRMMDDIAADHEQRDLLANELTHRIKNTLATVQAIAHGTFNKPGTDKGLLSDFFGRLATLSRTHDVLLCEHGEGAWLRGLITRTVEPLCDMDRFELQGQDVGLPARKALGLTMVLHELCTNAVKYGAFASPDGSVRLTWSISELPQGRSIDLVWIETDGPPVCRPGEPGFGTRLISRALGEGGTTVVTFEPTGLVCRMSIALPSLVSEKNRAMDQYKTP